MHERNVHDLICSVTEEIPCECIRTIVYTFCFVLFVSAHHQLFGGISYEPLRQMRFLCFALESFCSFYPDAVVCNTLDVSGEAVEKFICAYDVCGIVSSEQHLI